VQSVAIQPDGEILLGGHFGLLNSQPRQCLGRIENTGPADQILSFDGSTITWLRSGTGPDFWRVSFEGSTNSVDWIDLGAGTPIAGGWQLASVSFPTNGNIRVRGFVVAPTWNLPSNGSAAWMAESYLGAPLAVGQPAALVYSTGSTANLSAGVAGTEPLRYQWFFDGALLSGATSASLILTNIQSSQAGQYTVIATNVSGAITNDIGTLAVTAPPVIPQILLQGQQLTNGLMQFTWNTVYGLNYQIQYSTNLNGPVWQFFNGPVTNHSFLSGGYSFSHRSTDESLIITSCGSTLTFADPSPPDANRFYRVRYAQ